MVLKIKNRISYYKRYEKDIGGILRSNGKKIMNYSSILNTFWYFYRKSQKSKTNFLKNIRRYIYQLFIVDRQKKRKKMKKKFITLRLLKLFFITMTYKQFRNLALKMRAKAGNYEENYLSCIEGRIMSVIHRTNVIGSPFESMKGIKQGLVFLNLKSINNISTSVVGYLMCQLSTLFKFRFLNILGQRVRKQRFLSNVPIFIALSHVFFFFYVTRQIISKHLSYPIPIDIMRASGYAI